MKIPGIDQLVVQVFVAVRYPDGRIDTLFARRGCHSAYSGLLSVVTGKIDPADLPHQTEQSPAFYTSPAGVKVGKTELGGAAVAARRETAEEFGLSVDMGQMKLLDVYDEPSSWLRKQAIWRSGYGKVRRFYCFGGVVTPEQAACAAAGDDMLPGSLRRIPLVQLAAADRRDFAFNGMHLLLWSKFWNEKTDGFKVAARSSS